MQTLISRQTQHGLLPKGKFPWLQEFSFEVYQSGKKELNYRFFQPEGERESYPLVLWLHGMWGRGDGNEKQLSAGGNRFGPAYFSDPVHQESNPCFVVAPQCPEGKFWIRFRNNRSSRHLRWVMELLTELLAEHPIDPNRIYVAGQSMGGFATWALLAEYPDVFAGAVPISGGAPNRKLSRSLQAPVWAFHGLKDIIVRPWRSRKAVKAAEKTEVEVRFTEYAEGKHNIWPQVFSGPELANWLFAQER